MSVLSREMSAAEAARRRGMSTASVGRWKQTFLDAGTKALDEDSLRSGRGAGHAGAAAVADGTRPTTYLNAPLLTFPVICIICLALERFGGVVPAPAE